MATTNKKYVWVVAGGIQQIPMLKEIKARGYNILLTDGDPNAPGRSLADEFIVVDTYDVFEHLSIAQSRLEPPVAILTVAADVGPTVSAIADEFDLPAVDYEVAKQVRDKATMREILGIEYPVWQKVMFNDFSPERFWINYCKRENVSSYPCVVKPLNKAGSRGVSIVNNSFEWRRAEKLAKKADLSERHYIVEQYIENNRTEVSTDNFVVDGNVIFANAVLRYFSKEIFGLELGHMNPFKLTAEMKRKIKFAAKKLGVNYGPFKVDFIYNDEHGWTIIECATRLSGGFDHMYAAPIATGKNITSVMLDLALGNEVASRDKRLWNTEKKFAFTYAPILKPGIVEKISIPTPETTSYPWLKHIFVTFKNNVIEPLENCTQRPLFVIVEGDTEFQAIRRAKIIEKEIDIEYRS